MNFQLNYLVLTLAVVAATWILLGIVFSDLDLSELIGVLIMVSGGWLMRSIRS